MIVKREGKFFVVSHEGKDLGGPYDSKAEALKRLRQVEFYKHQPKGGK